MTAPVVRFEGTELGARSLWYRSQRQDDKLDLSLCIEGRE
jgi:hypothetical protein